ncbi:uncharacterized protein LOC142974203 [Anticarsia gemmatalis]|uniref:uncharacterized protein LOC142974203 n=1 Tax=Anticarsia gemmatalis TaxID=129554 RepID=UPI003F765150
MSQNVKVKTKSNFLYKTMMAYRLIFGYYYKFSESPILSTLNLDMVMWIVEVVIMSIVMCVSPILTEMALNDLDEIKAILSFQLLNNKDKNLQAVVCDAIDYIDACAAKYTLWNDFPMDVNLILGFISLCSSYIIALLQFEY